MNILVVDLDESLIKTDLLYEQAFAYLKKNPFNIFRMIAWLAMGGPLALKNRLATHVHPNVERLPYRAEVLEYIKEKRKDNHIVVLASASPQVWVQKVANHLGLFDHVLGSDKINLKGHNKYQTVTELTGKEKFTYIGDSASDIDIWHHCGSAVTVNASEGTLRRLKEKSTILASFADKQAPLKPLIKQMRVHQWAKNALLFLPMIAAHKIQLDFALNGILAFTSFGLAASAVYVINDLIDIDADRNHRTKKNRPLAAGTIRVKDALRLFIGLSVGALLFSWVVGLPFLYVILAYWGMNFLYTFFLKKEVILDIILLSGMYTMRLFAGAAAAQIAISHWLLSFSTLFFFSLACVKRYTELARSQNKPSIDGRGYRGMDQMAVLTLGAGTGLLSILVILLYLQSPEVKSLYSDVSRLWLLTPLLLYWLGRLWLLTGRDEIHDDPVVFAIKDKTSWICFALILATMVSAL